MPDRRTHRGAHPQDAELFSSEWHQPLKNATADLSWLLGRGYAVPSAQKIVGDRYALDARQRTAVMRCACGDEAKLARLSRVMPLTLAQGLTIAIDAYNVLTTVEVALGGGVVLAARDGAYRDMAAMHGSYRRVQETIPALELIGQMIAEAQVARAVWYLDQPVSNSGRLKTLMAELAERNRWAWDLQIVPDPDPVLIRSHDSIASADSAILDACHAKWVNLAREVVMKHVPQAWIVDLSGNG